MDIKELDKEYIAPTYARFPLTLVEGNGRRNCLSLVAYDNHGYVVARNYALFSHVPRTFTIYFR